MSSVPPPANGQGPVPPGLAVVIQGLIKCHIKLCYHLNSNSIPGRGDNATSAKLGNGGFGVESERIVKHNPATKYTHILQRAILKMHLPKKQR